VLASVGMTKIQKNADMGEFDRMMKHLVNVPKSAIDKKEKKIVR
jgi:hypothetical protein